MMRYKALNLIFILAVLISLIYSSTSDGQEDYAFLYSWPVEAGFGRPYDVAVDNSGNIYVVDGENHRIVKLAQDGDILLEWGEGGTRDGRFSSPRGIALDSSGNVYVADTRNHRIQKFTSEGVFLKKWGTGHLVAEEEVYFRYPRGIAVDALGNVYVADTDNHRIQKFTSEGVFLKKWGIYGNSGDGYFDQPHDVTVDDSGNVYVVDTHNNRVQKFTSEGVFLKKWGTGGIRDEQFAGPRGITVDSLGDIYVADSTNRRVQKFTPEGIFLGTWGRGGDGDGQFKFPWGVAVDGAGDIYIADQYNHRIQKFTSEGVFLKKWGTYGSADGQFKFPHYMAVDSSGNVYVADTVNHRVQKFTSDGVFVGKWGAQGSGDGQFQYPIGLAVDKADNVYVSGGNRVQKFTSDGVFLKKWGTAGTGNGQLDTPSGIAVDDLGNVYVADTLNNRVQKFTSEGVFLKKWTGNTGDEQFDRPHGLAVDSFGNVYVTDSTFYIQKFTSEGAFLARWGGEGGNDGRFDHPWGIAVDSSGDVYIADMNNHRVQKFTLVLPPPAVVSLETKQTVSKGHSFSATVNVETTTALVGFQFDVAFDPTILEAVAIDEGMFLAESGTTFWLEPNIDNIAGVITNIMCVKTGQGGIDGSGTLATITFNAIGVGESYIKLQNVSVSDSSAHPIATTILDGSIVVTEYPPWDVNRDGIVDVFDFVIVGRYFGETITTPMDPNPDVNGDGEVNLFDFVLVGMHFGEVHSPSAPSRDIWSFDPQYLSMLNKIYNIMSDRPSSDPGFLTTKRLLQRLILNMETYETKAFQNYPNPFNPETWIPYQLAESSDVNIAIYSATGQLIRLLDLGYKEAGQYVTRDAASHWDGTTDIGERVASGVYFYNIQAGSYSATKKMIVAQ